MNTLILRIKKVALTKDAKFEQAGTKKGTKKLILRWWSSGSQGGVHTFSLVLTSLQSYIAHNMHVQMEGEGPADQHTCTLWAHLPAGQWSSALQASVCSHPNPTALCRWHSGHGPVWMAAGWECRRVRV